MLFIPASIALLLSFPGVIVHEMAHELFCRIFGVAVLDVCYFRFGNPAGYVVHEVPRNTYQHIMIALGPLLVNTIVGAVIAAPAVVPVFQFRSASVMDYVLVWLGVTIAMHSFPSTADAKSIWAGLWKRRAPILARVAGTPIVLLIYIGAFGSIFWLDLVYGIAVVWVLPKLFVSFFA